MNTNREIVAQLRSAGYTGPTSYSKSKLLSIMASLPVTTTSTWTAAAAPAPIELSIKLPAKSLAFFTDLAEDAPNWSGNPWLDGNVAAGASASGMSQTLVRNGLITIGHDDGDAYAIFTQRGIEFAAELGIEIY